MPDFATPNLPSRAFDATAQFYGALGFTQVWRDAGWMILKRGDLTLEFFPPSRARSRQERVWLLFQDGRRRRVLRDYPRRRRA